MKPKHYRLLGVTLILLDVVLTIKFKCPPNLLTLSIYILFGIGIALLFPQSATKMKLNAYGISGGIACALVLVFWNPVKRYGADVCNKNLLATSLTVFVHGKKGKQDMVLRKNGKVILDIGKERKEMSINENGQAFFQNLYDGDKVRLNVDFSEPYKAVFPDSIYSIDSEKPIYLEVVLEGIDKIRGTIIYDDLPLVNVTLKVDNILVSKSDSLGNFIINIPETLQSNNGYKVACFKNGFKYKEVTAYPQTGQPLSIVMEK